MPQSTNSTAWLQIHICVLLWGVTAVLGKLITLSAVELVWWRLLLASAPLLCLPQAWRGLRQLSMRLVLCYAGIGALIGLHFLAFFASVKLANASVAATCIALSSVFMAIVDPWLTGRRFERRELMLAVAVVPGVAMVVGGTPAAMHLGILIGTGGALLVAIFGSLNKRLVHHADPFTVTAIELTAGALLLTVLTPLLADKVFVIPSAHDLVLLAGLAWACTLLPFILLLTALRQLTAFSTQLAINLEPVYAVLLAIPILGEQRELNAPFYVGVSIIVGVVFVHSRLTKQSQ